jgi:hypothetical protein
MNKLIALLLIALLFGVVVISGCTISEEKKHGFLGTEKTTTRVGPGGIEKETKTCPFWDRNC